MSIQRIYIAIFEKKDQENLKNIIWAKNHP